MAMSSVVNVNLGALQIQTDLVDQLGALRGTNHPRREDGSNPGICVIRFHFNLSKAATTTATTTTTTRTVLIFVGVRNLVMLKIVVTFCRGFVRLTK